MDLSKFDTSTASESGRFLHLEFDGEKLYEDREPCGLRVLGPTSSTYKRIEKQLEKARMERIRIQRGGKVKGLSGDNDELYASLVTEYVNLTLEGQPLSNPTPSDVQALFDRFPFIRDQVIAFVDDDANWLGESSTS